MINEQVQDFKQRSPAQQYAVIYLDASNLPILRNSVAREVMYLAIGIQANGHKAVLGYQLTPTE